jgi:HEPN domain-containing protein
VRHGLFFAHLALEKTLKAHVCRATSELAPPTHNLVRLAERIALPLEQSQLELLAEVNSFNIEGRYPEMSLPLPPPAEVERYLARIGELLTWLSSRF